MKQIRLENFSGGINDVLEPHLLDSRFSNDLKNCLVTNGAIKSSKKLEVTDPVDSYLTYQTGERSIVHWADQYYWTDNDSGEMDSTHGHLGVDASTNNITAADGEAGGRFPENKIFKYFYTYATSEGYRGAPFSLTEFASYTAPPGDIGSVMLSGFDTSIPDYVTFIEVWRTTGDGVEFYRVGQVNRFSGDEFGNIVYEDKVPDQDLILNEKYDLTAPDYKPEVGKYLCEKNGVFFLAVGSKVYFSKQSNPHSYPPLQYVNFDDEITGMLAFENYVFVMSINRSYVLWGDSMADIAKEEIPDAQGIKNWKTAQRVKNMPVWVSNDGLCAYVAYDQRSGRKVQVLTENLFNLPDSPKSAVVANDIYYLFYENETIAFDFKDHLKISRLDWVLDWGWYDKNNDMLIGKLGVVYYKDDNGDDLEFEYLSPEFVGDDMQNLKQLGRLHVDADCELKFTYYTEGIEVWSYTLEHNGTNQRTEFIDRCVMGRRIQVKIQGIGTLRGISFDFRMRRM
jgi:hypothetical protein